MTKEKIVIGIDNELIELKGEILENFELDRAAQRARQEKIDLEIKARSEARASALAKLAALGLTEDEIAAL